MRGLVFSQPSRIEVSQTILPLLTLTSCAGGYAARWTLPRPSSETL